jgi:hypothetical protein
VTGLTNGVTYTFTVKATNAVGDGTESAPSNSVKLSTEPGAPANLASVVAGSSITLNWSAPASNGGSAITDYIIEYQLTTGGTWSVFADGTSVNTTAIVNGLANRTSYDFRVSAVNIIGQSTTSNIVTATPGEPAQVFIQNFTDLTNPSIGTAVRITNEGVGEYEYQYTWCVTDAVDNLCGGGNDIFSATAAKLIQAHENYDMVATSTVPLPGNYWFHINVTYGSQMSTANQSFTAVATFPEAPTTVIATSGNAQAIVSFLPPASNGGSAIIGYTVTSGPGGLIGTGSSSPITVTGLTNGTAYTFTVTATNEVGVGTASAPSNSVTPVTIPDVPTNVSAIAGNATVALSWSAPMITGGLPIIDYVIEYKLTTDSTWTIFADGLSPVTNATVTGLTNNLSYDFRISAVNDFGRSSVNTTSANPSAPVTPPTQSGGGGGGGSGGSLFNFGYQAPVETKKDTVTTTTKNIIVEPNTKEVAETVSTVKKPTTVKTNSTSGSENNTITYSADGQGTNNNKNEVTATPVETPVIKIIPPEPEAPTKIVNNGDDTESEIPWIPIAGTGAVIAGGSYIFFIFRRRFYN